MLKMEYVLEKEYALKEHDQGKKMCQKRYR